MNGKLNIKNNLVIQLQAKKRERERETYIEKEIQVEHTQSDNRFKLNAAVTNLNRLNTPQDCLLDLKNKTSIYNY